jgi:hypothetical protein
MDYIIWMNNYGSSATPTSKPPTPKPTTPSTCGNGTCESSETCSTCESDCGKCPPGSGVLQFKSGFEANSYLGGDTIKGIDNSAPKGNFYYQNGRAEIAQDPTGRNNKVLHTHVYSNSGGKCRSQWNLKQNKDWSDDGTPNLFDKQFYRYRMFIPLEIKNTNLNRWYMIWESHTWAKENTRYGIYLRRNSNNNEWHFRVVQQRPENCLPNCIAYWENTSGQSVTVPFGQWFTLEIFFNYHDTNGEFYVAATREGGQRQVTAHYKGKTKFDTKIRDQMMFKHYHHTEYIDKLPGGTHHYYDDFEIWSNYPPGY